MDNDSKVPKKIKIVVTNSNYINIKFINILVKYEKIG